MTKSGNQFTPKFPFSFLTKKSAALVDFSIRLCLWHYAFDQIYLIEASRSYLFKSALCIKLARSQELHEKIIVIDRNVEGRLSCKTKTSLQWKIMVLEKYDRSYVTNNNMNVKMSLLICSTSFYGASDLHVKE